MQAPAESQDDVETIPWVQLPPGGAPKGTREWSQTYAECAGDIAQCPFVAIGESQVDRILLLAGVAADDVVCDLGFGDGTFLLRACATVGCRGIGAEINGDLVQRALSSAALLPVGVQSLLNFTEGPFERMVLSPEFDKATVIYVHLVPEVLQKLVPVLRTRIAAGVRVVSQRFEIPGFESDKRRALATAACDDDAYFGDMGPAFLYTR
mmetsp:Transcript_13031/g.35535  ORF Transcript_13031/g.35535 Transcript_13031/m.35535 type:complete len:209 (-) Transcript_13031:198-824(-)